MMGRTQAAPSNPYRVRLRKDRAWTSPQNTEAA